MIKKVMMQLPKMFVLHIHTIKISTDGTLSIAPRPTQSTLLIYLFSSRADQNAHP